MWTLAARARLIGRRSATAGEYRDAPDTIALAATLLLAWCFQWFLTNAAFLRWRAARTLRGLLCAVGLGSRVDRDDVMAASDASTPTTSQRWRTWRPSAYSPRGISTTTPASATFSPPGTSPTTAAWASSPPASPTAATPVSHPLQCLYHTRSSPRILRRTHDSCDARGFCVTCEYQAHVKRALDAEPKASFSIGHSPPPSARSQTRRARGHRRIPASTSAGCSAACCAVSKAGGPDAEKTLDLRTQETTMVYHVFGGYARSRGVFRVRTREPLRIRA